MITLVREKEFHFTALYLLFLHKLIAFPVTHLLYEESQSLWITAVTYFKCEDAAGVTPVLF